MQVILQELIYDSLGDGAVWPFDRRYIRPPHFHGQLEGLLIRRGSAVLRRGTRDETVRGGQLCWILPGVAHVMDSFSPDFDMWVFGLDAALVQSCWRSIGNGSPNGSHDRDDVGVPRALFGGWTASLGERLAGRDTVELRADDVRRVSQLALAVWNAAHAIEARRALSALGALALQVTLPAVDDARDVSVSELASCLLLSSPMMDRSTVAAELGVSAGFLSRRFQAELGVTFVEHRARMRVAHFLALAQSGRRNLLEAALEAGFGSYSQFHRTFSRVSGSRPRDYLKIGRHQRQLLVARDAADPRSAASRALPVRDRHRAPLDS